MKCLVLVFLALLMTSFSFAGEYYPARLAPRLLGTSQGRAGDCMAEADVNALEQAFAIRGYPVRFSLFYRHAFNWRTQSTLDSGLKLLLDDGDQRLMDQAGGLIPEYMWPEDGKGFPEVDSFRPQPARAAVFDPAFPHTNAFGFKQEWKTLTPGFSHSIDLATVKFMISIGEAITLPIQGALIAPPASLPWTASPVTGLLGGRYSMDALKTLLNGKPLDQTLDHQVQVVGFDDSLYADGTYTVPGALIIRNTWNSDYTNHAVFDPDENRRHAADLQKFRLKIHSTNLPGFYAIPFQYLVDLAAEKAGLIVVYSINYRDYAAAYLQFRDRYQMVNAPYACESRNPFDGDSWSAARVRDVIRHYREWLRIYRDPVSTAEQIRAARTGILELAREAASDFSQPWNSKFIHYAKLSRNRAGGPDRIREFYSGAFKSYYCNSDSQVRIWPSPETTERNLFQLALDELALDPGSPSQWNKMLFALSELAADLK